MTYAEIFDLIDENLASGNKIPAVKHREVEHALLDYIQANLSQSGDIKRIKCDLEYYNDNFDSNGLGKNLRLGWAVCNGNNGTDDVTGRVGIGWGTGYTAFNGIGGAATHTLTLEESAPHEHAVQSYSGVGSTGTHISAPVTGAASGAVTSSKGGGQPHNNMQPYIIQLYIMKL